MPTYYAIGATATLATCDLQATLSSNISSLKQGNEQKRDVARVQSALGTAIKLSEQPIGDDGVVQFVGVNGDMPFYSVEAGRKPFDALILDYNEEMRGALDEPAAALSNETPLFGDDSPLTSLGTTPTPTKQSFNESITKQPLPIPPTMQDMAFLASDDIVQHEVQTARSLLNSSNAQALVLNIQLSNRSFLPEEKISRTGKHLASKDLKVEIFINGQLAEVRLVHGNEKRRRAEQVDGDKIRFAGTRIHRQVEKPWIYLQETLDPNNMPGFGDAEHRWNAVSSAHVAEARIRGRDRFGDAPPSADFLTALADVQFPQRLSGHQGIGIVDIVITAGSGKKYGPETFYLTTPRRMDDSNYQPQPFLHPDGVIKQKTPLRQLNIPDVEPALLGVTSSQYGIPAKVDVASLTPKKTVDLTQIIDLDIDPGKTIVGSYENSRGMTGKAGRTLRQRLGDLKKMNSANLEVELTKLSDEFCGKEPAQKKLKLKDALTSEFDIFGPSAEGGTESTIDAVELITAAPQLSPTGIGSASLLTQNRTDMAINEETTSDGALLRKITPTSPQRTPKKKTKASALAGFPISTPVKTSPRKNVPPVGTNRGKAGAGDFSISNRKLADPNKRDASPSRSTTVIEATPQKTKSAEQSVSETLKTFKISECCQGSCVSYVEDQSVCRQIGKARGGEFTEETFLVGMRFVVV